MTTSQNLHINGTATPSTTVTLERADLGVLGTAAVGSGGTFSYDYSGTTLAEGTYDFVARDDDGSASKSAYSADFLVTVDRTAPAVTASVPATTGTLAPVVHVTASDLVGIAANATVALDLATSSGGPWTLAYATGTLTNDQATITLPTLSGTGTWYVRARALDLAGNEGTSGAQSVAVNAVTSWSGTAQALSADPEQGDFLMQMGDLTFSHALDLDQSPGTAQAGNPALVYHSSQVSQKPIVQVQLTSANNASLPANITAQLTFNGTAMGTLTYSTTGFSAGDTLTLALQSLTAVTTTGRYDYSVSVQAGTWTQTFTGYTFVVAQDASTLGSGWSFAGVDTLLPLAASGSDPAGVLRIFGDGGYRFYQGTTSFTSPAGDNGTLSVSGTTYTYSTPDGQAWTFSTSGTFAYLTQWTSADGQETLQYRYDGSHRLSGMTAVDAAVTTLTYSAGSVLIQTVNSRTTTLTLDGSNNLTGITNPDGGVETLTYDTNHRLTQEQLGLLQNNWTYATSGVLSTETTGRGSYSGLSNPSVASFGPALTVGLSTLAAGTVYASLTDPDGNTTLQQMDGQGRTLSQVAADGGVTTLTYSNGFLTSQTDPLNRTTTYALDSKGYVTLETLPDGSTITYQYQSAFHALTTLTDERGDTTTYAYDSGGHLTSTTDALSHTATASYTSGGLLQSVTDQLGHTTTYQYDGDRRLQDTIDALGHHTTLAYDANGNVQTVTNALGRVTTTNYDVMDRLTGTVDALGNQTTTTYDVSGLEETSTDALGVQTSLVYDVFSRGLVVATFTGVGSAVEVSALNSYDAAMRLTATRSELGSWTSVQYDGVGRQTTTTDALGDTTQSDHDLAGQVTAARDAMGNWTRYAYNSRGDQTSVTDPLGNVTTSAFDRADNRTAVTDPLNHTVTYAYDALDRVSTVTDALSHTGTLTYDAAGNLSTVTDPLGAVTSYAYDALNRRTTQTDAVGTGVQRTTSVGYDAVGNVTTSTDALNNVTTLAYDALNRVTAGTDPLNHTRTLTYDAVGDVLTSVDPLSKTTTFSYDALHRQVAFTDPLGHTVTTVRDAAGDAAATIDPLGNVSVNIIDPLGRTVGSVDALGNVTQVVLNPDGGARMVVDPDGNETHYVVDGLGRDTVTIDPLGNRTTMAYDGAGRLTQVTDRDGRVINYSYDAANRETGEVWLSAAGATVNVVTYGYDANDNLTSAADYNGTVTYSYDALNRVSSYTNVFGQVLTYTYNGNDQVTQRADSLGGTLTYVYDNAQRMTSEQFSGTGPTGTVVRVDFGYDARNEQTSKTWYSNLAGTTVVATSAYSYDDAGRVTSIVNKDSGATTLSYYDYSYDNADRVTNQTWWSKIGTVTYSGSATYTYDATSQLTGDGTNNYSFDGNGNRTMAGYQTGTDNRMSNDGTYTYTYDNAGNLIEKSKGAGQETWYYGYDTRNALTSIRETSDGTTNTLTVTYTYDVEGKRVKEQDWSTGSSTVETRFAYDGRDIWADLDSSNNLLVRRLFGPGDQVLTRTVASGATAGVWAYFTDNLGSVRDLANWSAQVQDHLDYSGFGVLTESTASVGDGYGFTGLKEQKAAGVLLADNRAMLLSAGRWMSQDPIMFWAGDSNVYRYLHNATTLGIDPSGLKGLLESVGDLFAGIGQGGYNAGVSLASTAINGTLAIPNIASMLTTGKPITSYIPGGYGTLLEQTNPAQQVATALGGAYQQGGGGAGGVGQAALTAFQLFLSNPTSNPLGTSLQGLLASIETGDWSNLGRPLGHMIFDAITVFALASVGPRPALSPKGPKSCFPAGTPVHTFAGLKAIEQIEVGDRVWAYDHKQLRWVKREVVEVYQLLHQGRMATLQVQGETLRATAGHPFWVVRGEGLAERRLPGQILAYVAGGLQEGRWVLACDLRGGDQVLLRHGEVVSLESVRLDPVEETVYNFHVDELENYAVGGCGVLVHNRNTTDPGNGSNAGNAGEGAQPTSATGETNPSGGNGTRPALQAQIDALQDIQLEAIRNGDPVPGIHEPGPFAVEGIPTQSGASVRSGRITQTNNANGNANGCHICGAEEPGTPNGNWIKDHIPSTDLTRPGDPQKIYPSCQACSDNQGWLVYNLRLLRDWLEIFER
jgi:RHS repeat-associated protein